MSNLLVEKLGLFFFFPGHTNRKCGIKCSLIVTSTKYIQIICLFILTKAIKINWVVGPFRLLLEVDSDSPYFGTMFCLKNGLAIRLCLQPIILSAWSLSCYERILSKYVINDLCVKNGMVCASSSVLCVYVLFMQFLLFCGAMISRFYMFDTSL